jgi:hypothetical protein
MDRFSKRPFGARMSVRTRSARYYFHVKTDNLAVQVPFARKQVSFFDFQRFGQVLNVCVCRWATLGFDIGEDVPGHVAPQHLQPRDELVLRPFLLLTILYDIRTYNISAAVHTHLQTSWAIFHICEPRERPRCSEPNPCCEGLELPVVVEVLLEQRRLRIGLALSRVAQWKDHHRKIMNRSFASSRTNPNDKEEAQASESHEKIIPVFLNHRIQELRRTADIDHGMFHMNPSGASLFISTGR